MKSLRYVLFLCGKHHLKNMRRIAGFLLILTFLGTSVGCTSTKYSTVDITDYGIIKGNGDDSKASEYIFSFFPKQIEEYFSEVKYSYFAETDGKYEYECYLEFTIPDSELFEVFLKENVDEGEATVFSFDHSFMEYSLSNYLLLEELLYSDENGYPITYAAIQKILYSREEKRFVFIAIAVSELAYTKDIHVFFDRFQIDPLEYQMTAFVGQDGIGGDPIPYVDWPGRPHSGQ